MYQRIWQTSTYFISSLTPQFGKIIIIKGMPPHSLLKLDPHMAGTAAVDCIRHLRPTCGFYVSSDMRRDKLLACTKVLPQDCYLVFDPLLIKLEDKFIFQCVHSLPSHCCFLITRDMTNEFIQNYVLALPPHCTLSVCHDVELQSIIHFSSFLQDDITLQFDLERSADDRAQIEAIIMQRNSAERAQESPQLSRSGSGGSLQNLLLNAPIVPPPVTNIPYLQTVGTAAAARATTWTIDDTMTESQGLVMVSNVREDNSLVIKPYVPRKLRNTFIRALGENSILKIHSSMNNYLELAKNDVCSLLKNRHLGFHPDVTLENAFVLVSFLPTGCNLKLYRNMSEKMVQACVLALRPGCYLSVASVHPLALAGVQVLPAGVGIRFASKMSPADRAQIEAIMQKKLPMRSFVASAATPQTAAPVLAVTEENSCVICLENNNQRNAMVPCGHRILCENCYLKSLSAPQLYKKCPLCQTPVTQIIKLL